MFLLAELRDDQEWRTRFSSRRDILSKLAEEAPGRLCSRQDAPH